MPISFDTANDSSYPTIQLKGQAIHVVADYGAPFDDPGAAAKDGAGRELTVTTSGEVDTSRPGTYTLMYRAEDRNGNGCRASRTVRVRQTPKPLCACVRLHHMENVPDGYSLPFATWRLLGTWGTSSPGMPMQEPEEAGGTPVKAGAGGGAAAGTTAGGAGCYEWTDVVTAERLPKGVSAEVEQASEEELSAASRGMSMLSSFGSSLRQMTVEGPTQAELDQEAAIAQGIIAQLTVKVVEQNSKGETRIFTLGKVNIDLEKEAERGKEMSGYFPVEATGKGNLLEVLRLKGRKKSNPPFIKLSILYYTKGEPGDPNAAAEAAAAAAAVAAAAEEAATEEGEAVDAVDGALQSLKVLEDKLQTEDSKSWMSWGAETLQAWKPTLSENAEFAGVEQAVYKENVDTATEYAVAGIENANWLYEEAEKDGRGQQVLEEGWKAIERVRLKANEHWSVLEEGQKLYGEMYDSSGDPEKAERFKEYLREAAGNCQSVEEQQQLLAWVRSEDMDADVVTNLTETWEKAAEDDEAVQVYEKGNDLLAKASVAKDSIVETAFAVCSTFYNKGENGEDSLVETTSKFVTDMWENNQDSAFVETSNEYYEWFAADVNGARVLEAGQTLLSYYLTPEQQSEKIREVEEAGGDASAMRENFESHHAGSESAAGPPATQEPADPAVPAEGGEEAGALVAAGGPGAPLLTDQAYWDAMSDVRDGLLLFLQAYLPTVKIPPISGVSQTPAGEVAYSLNGVMFSSFEFPPEGLNTSLYEEYSLPIVIEASGIVAKVSNFTWFYRQSAWPMLTADGLADCTVQGATVRLTLDLEVDDETGEASFVIRESSVNIEELVLQVHGNSTSWLYNMLIGVFSKMVKDTVEEALRDAVTWQLDNLMWGINSMAGYAQDFLQPEDGAPAPEQQAAPPPHSPPSELSDADRAALEAKAAAARALLFSMDF